MRHIVLSVSINTQGKAIKKLRLKKQSRYDKIQKIATLNADKKLDKVVAFILSPERRELSHGMFTKTAEHLASIGIADTRRIQGYDLQNGVSRGEGPDRILK